MRARVASARNSSNRGACVGRAKARLSTSCHGMVRAKPWPGNWALLGVRRTRASIPATPRGSICPGASFGELAEPDQRCMAGRL